MGGSHCEHEKIEEMLDSLDRRDLPFDDTMSYIESIAEMTIGSINKRAVSTIVKDSKVSLY